MLRIQVADRLASIRGDLEACRTTLMDNGQFEGLDKIGVLVSKFKTIEGEIRHAAQGYSGISAKIQVKEAQLNKLYEYDLNLITLLTEIRAEVDKVKSLAATGGVHDGADAIKAVMAGAHAVQMVSALLARGPEHLTRVRDDMARWLEAHEYDSLAQARGSMNLLGCPDPTAYERANYMTILQGWTGSDARP
jgi:hypothetical protein